MSCWDSAHCTRAQSQPLNFHAQCPWSQLSPRPDPRQGTRSCDTVMGCGVRVQSLQILDSIRILPEVLITKENSIKFLKLGLFWDPQLNPCIVPVSMKKRAWYVGSSLAWPCLPKCPGCLRSHLHLQNCPSLGTPKSSQQELGPEGKECRENSQSGGC